MFTGQSQGFKIANPWVRKGRFPKNGKKKRKILNPSQALFCGGISQRGKGVMPFSLCTGSARNPVPQSA